MTVQAVQSPTDAQNGLGSDTAPLVARWWRLAHCATHPDAEWWLSSRPNDRARACEACLACPVIVECGLAADREGQTFGVWGGRVRTL